jgi:hypothetical protein
MSKEIDNILSIAGRLTRETRIQTRVAEERRGEKAREFFQDVRAKLAATLAGLRKIQPEAAKARKAAEMILESGAVLTPSQRNALDRCVRELAGAANGHAAAAVESALQLIENLGDDPQRWPKKDFANGALANLGYACDQIVAAVQVINEIGEGASVGPVSEAESHDAGAVPRDDSPSEIQYISNVQHD